MSDEKPPSRPRASTRTARKKPFGAASIGRIANHEEEIKCRLLDALGLLASDALYTRHRRHDVISRAGVDPSDGYTALRELSDAKALFFNLGADDVRIHCLASKKRVKEAREALRVWWSHKRPAKTDGGAERKDHRGLESIADKKTLTTLTRRLKQMASDTDDPPYHDGRMYVGWLELPMADSPACRTCGGFVKVLIDVGKGQDSAIRNRLAWDTTITCNGSGSRAILRSHFTAPLPKQKAAPRRRRRPRTRRRD